ncbi:MAG: AAA family ATPase [Pseudomonadota bacterium]
MFKLVTTPEASELPREASGPADSFDTLVEKVEGRFERIAHPEEMLNDEDFIAAVNHLVGASYSLEQVGNFATGGNWVLRAIAFEALARGDESGEIVDRAVRATRTVGAYPMYFLVRYLNSRAKIAVVDDIVSAASYWWRDNEIMIAAVSSAIDAQQARGQSVELSARYAALEEDDLANADAFIDSIPDPQGAELKAARNAARAQRVDEHFLRSIGDLVTSPADDLLIYDTDQLVRLQAAFIEDLDAGSIRTMLLVGPSGVGKSVARAKFQNMLLERGWRIVHTSAQQLIADRKYIGEIEGQIKRLVENAAVSKRIAIFVNNLRELHELGRTSGKNASILDQLWPAIEQRQIVLIGEATPAGLQRLVRSFPSLSTRVRVLTMQPSTEVEAAKLANQLLADLTDDLDTTARAQVIDESVRLAQQYLGHKSMPGSVLSLLELAALRAEREGTVPLSRAHVLSALGQVSGLPAEILDDRQGLDVEALRASFRKRVVGQDEAVDCLVERLAMLKAGLSDPGRPIGVFLFAGPTGTGKTEIAKTLAEVMFGSESQMIRLDMSELQDAQSVWRLVGDQGQDNQGRSLVARIREQPFSVVLLDEFEKAHARVWDLFLQVFDDGRLTDSRGDTADFRHSIIILTSNLGATISGEAGPGFTSRAGAFSQSDVTRSVNRAFRREFINRLDRVIVFRPLSRDVMRGILRKELSKVLGRRGLRSKQWAVEWEDSAIEFLLDQGFTPDLGARPLRRAIEEHLLAPLSLTIVQNEAPSGEQFLFVRSSGDALDVVFVDPDAEPEPSGSDPVTGIASSLKEILLASGRIEGDRERVMAAFASIEHRVSGDAWQQSKAELVAQMSDGGFWDRDDRSETLDRIELIDRVEAATANLRRLSSRLGQKTNATILRSMAQRLFALREGIRDIDDNRPTRALIGARIITEDRDRDGADAFLWELAEMYRAWARARGMRTQPVAQGDTRYPFLLDVFGFGSFGLLDPEAGVHVLELPARNRQLEKVRARVNVVTFGSSIEDVSSRETRIVRRYRREPSPLVRDSVHGWKTGRLDLVLGGAFDLFESDYA